MKWSFLAAILFLGCTLNCSRVFSAAVPKHTELKKVFLTLQTLAPKEAEVFLLSSGFEIRTKHNRRAILFVGRLDQDSIHVFIFKKRLKTSFSMYQIELVKPNLNWYQVKNYIYELEFEIKRWIDKSPDIRITQPTKDCEGYELDCLKKKKFEYQISWHWLSTHEQTLVLYLNEEANVVFRFFAYK